MIIVVHMPVYEGILRYGNMICGDFRYIHDTDHTSRGCSVCVVESVNTGFI